MQLYAATSQQFILDTVENRIAEKLKASFFQHYRFNPSPGEIRSWQNSLSKMCNVLQYASLSDHGVILEYQLPMSSKRLDCMVTGVDAGRRLNAVIVELKQWDAVGPSEVEDCVITAVGGAPREVLHPSRQVGNYQEYLEDCYPVFHSGEVALSSCSYLHNFQYHAGSPLFDARHRDLLSRYPLFTGDQTQALADFMSGSVGGGRGQEVMKTVLRSKYKASKKLLEHTSRIIKSQKVYVLLDEQQVVFNSVLHQAAKSFHEKNKVVVLIKGGPGTGKSVIAMNLVAELCAQNYNAQHATGSRAFTENIKKVVGNRAGVQFKYFNSYPTAGRDEIDVLVLDEAHRLRPSSHNRFTPRSARSELSQTEELIHAAKVSVFFIDDLQVVRPGEVGSSELIRAAASKAGAALREYELEAQFRCNGSDGFINWVDNTLGIRRTANTLWDTNDPFEFRIAESVQELERSIRERQQEGFSARLAAGFCWPWSYPDGQGRLPNDVTVGGWSMPWNARPDSRKLAKGIPKSHYWASDPNGIDQVGCVYTAQGFEFDYVGVIFGLDLRYDPKGGTWVGDKTQSHDAVVKKSKELFVPLVKNTYRVLLTRGMKGCYVYFMDEATRNFFRSRVE
ncbi:MAG: DUF2075 domain-containing protein [Acidobacteria bacterium]|nr:DUF2075 domain-containing protein [Acidobacteriota bacterium]